MLASHLFYDNLDSASIVKNYNFLLNFISITFKYSLNLEEAGLSEE